MEKKTVDKIAKVLGDILAWMLGLIFIAIPIGLFVAFIVAFVFSYEEDSFRSIFWWTFGIMELVVFPLAYFFGDKLPKTNYKPLFSLTDFLGSSSRRGIRVKGFRIKKYDPTSWKKKDGDKLFY